MSKKVLIVDDDIKIIELLSACIDQAGYKCQPAFSGKEAIGLFIYNIDTDPFSLVILDVVMAEIDGFGVLETIRREEQLRGIPYGKGVPVIMLTGYKSTYMQSFSKGCDDYIIKPVDTAELIEKIKHHMNKNE